jgi:fibronectin-binding autotransporter adhesin
MCGPVLARTLNPPTDWRRSKAGEGPTVNVRGIARLGTLAVGLGIGTAWAHTPVASADSSADWSSTIDSLLSGASPAPATPIDLDISFDGYTIYAGGGSADAITNTGDYSLAIAYGADAYAATGGTGDVAVADGSGALAWAVGGTGDVSEAVGTNADAWAGGYGEGVTGADYDTAIDIGNNSVPAAYGTDIGAYAGNSGLAGGTDGGTGVHDTAIDIGNNTNDSGGDGSNDGAFAGAGGLGNGSGDGNSDTAIDVGNNSGSGFDGSFAVEGNGNYASESGDGTGPGDYIYAGQGNDNTAIGAGDTLGVDAYGGNDNYAYVDGPTDSTALAYDGDSNIAYVSDPFGAGGSPDSAVAGGSGFSNDLAEVLFAHGNATADTAPLLYDIISLFGNFSGSL